MDERESSTASSVDFYASEEKPTTTLAEHSKDTVLSKRKAEYHEHLPSNQQKKPRFDSPSRSACALNPCAGLPPAIWQHVFLYCSLSDLGRLVQVNQLFHSYLTEVQDVSLSDPDHGSLRLLKSDSIWASARNALPVKSPKPLPGFSERHIWQLVWSKKCQFCEKLNSGTVGEKIWQKGPGTDDVRTVWPFGIRACGECLMERCQTDASLLFSNANALRPALPYVFLTSDRHYIPAYMLQAATTPAGVEIAKYYYKPHVDDINKELNEALSLGPAAAEEWSKGLEARGQERMKCAENWERWEVKYQWWSDHQRTKLASSATPSPAQTTHIETIKSPPHHAPSPVLHAPTPASKYGLVSAMARHGHSLSQSHFTAPVHSLTSPAPTHPYMHSRPPTVSHNSQSSRGERNLHDANEAKANRKADIERRCQQMNPPIPPNVLRHMDAFKAAIVISQPMSDDAWSILEPRLVAQLAAAQQAESDHVSRVSSHPKTADRRPLDINSKESKEIMDREWDDSQRPIRDKLSAFADYFINQDWDGGRAVTYENSPKFAVDLLVHVRRKFYAESANEHGASDNDGSDTGKPKLVLDSMKWVYDNKIKNITEQFRKELFLCYGSGCQVNWKFYGFEGIIQHFGAKHTNAFSVGNVVVAWREAEWPEETPFHPDPISVKHAFHSTPGPTAHSGYSAYYGGCSRAGTSTPHMQTHLPQASPGPYQYNGQYAGPFAPPQMSSAAMSGYEYSQPYNMPMDSYQYQSLTTQGFGPQLRNGFMTSPAMSTTAIAPPPAGPPQLSGMSDTLHRPDDANHRTSLFDKQVSSVIEMAQDIWKHTSGVKDLPNSLRVYVLLQRVISKFHVEFNHEPTLNHFIDAFSNHEIPRALKNAPGLSCKVCQEVISQSASGQEERKTYTVLNLFLHFRSQHIITQVSGYGNAQISNSLDWKENMIELPGDRVISGLIHAPGMDDEKLHTVATVFPQLFPTPLPKMGKTDNTEVTSPARSLPKDPKDSAHIGGTPGKAIERSGPSSLASPHADSPRLPKSEDEYDPQRPALPPQANHLSRASSRKVTYRSSPISENMPRYYTESHYYPLGPTREEFNRPQEYVEYDRSPRRYREEGSLYNDYPERRPLNRDQEAFYSSDRDEFIFAHPRAERFEPNYRPISRSVRYMEHDSRYTGHPFREEAGSLGPSPVNEKSAADRFLDEFIPNPPASGSTGPGASRIDIPQPAAADAAPDDGPRYTPPPPNLVFPEEGSEQRRPPVPPRSTAPSTTSNGSRYGESRSSGRHVPTPDTARYIRKPGPYRRRDRYQDHGPSRYYRYMGPAREEPYIRGASMSRAQSKRYEEQRRRIDQQETPQPNAEPDAPQSRDQSVERGPIDDAPYPPRRPPQDYVSVQDRLHPYLPPSYRHAGYAEEPRGGPSPVYVDEYGYEIIMPRDPRPSRASYMAHPHHGRYYEPEHVQYVPMPYERPLPRQYEGGPEYVYYEGRERDRALPPRRPSVFEQEAAFEAPPESAYEAPPGIKVESGPPVPEGL